MKQAYCLMHVPFEGPGVFAWELQENGYELTTYLVPERGMPSTPGDLLLVMGGPMSVNDDEPWLKDEIEFVRRAVLSGTPVLGICLGSQILAKAMGGSVAPGPAIEVGMTRICLTDAGRSDPAFQDVGETVDVFEWHGEGIEAPPGAVVLASSTHYPVQAYRYGTNALGLLFHIELERSGIEKLCENGRADIAKAGVTGTTVIQKAKMHLPLLHQWARNLVLHMASLRPAV